MECNNTQEPSTYKSQKDNHTHKQQMNYGCEDGKEAHRSNSPITEIEVEMIQDSSNYSDSVVVNVSSCDSQSDLVHDRKPTLAPIPYSKNELHIKSQSNDCDTSWEQAKGCVPSLLSKHEISTSASFPTSFSDQAGTSALVIHKKLSDLGDQIETAVDTLSSFANDYLSSITHDLNGLAPSNKEKDIDHRATPKPCSDDDIYSLSTMERMRQQRQHVSTHNSNKSSKSISASPSSSSFGDSPKEKLKKSRLRKMQASRIGNELAHDPNVPNLDETGNNISKNSPLESITENIVDFSMVTKPISEVIVLSQSALVEAFMGKKCGVLEDILSISSSYYDDDSAGSLSSYEEDDDDDNYNQRDANDEDIDSMYDSLDESEFSYDDSMPNRRGRTTSIRRGRRGSGDDKVENKTKGGAIKPFLDQITTQGVNLHWHSKPNNDGKIRQPLHIQAHIHISDCMDDESDQVEPNLTWSPANSRTNEEDLLESVSNKQRCSLFDVTSIHKATANSSRILQMYPTITDPEKCVTIKLNDKTILLFEASNVVEAKKVVYGLRWIIARLSFNLIIGNNEICAELLPLPRSKKGTCTHNNNMFTSEIMNDVTNQLVEKSLKRLTHNGMNDTQMV